MWQTWREAMRSALYGPAGFYTRGEPPARHFRTSVHVSPRYATALLTVLRSVDTALGQPGQVHLVDVGAGRGELLSQLLAAADPALGGRIAPYAVEVSARPATLDPRIRWVSTPPPRITGMVIASEWLDNIPLDVAELTPAGLRLLLVDPATGAERPGPPPGAADAAWLRRWWPLGTLGDRAEIGRTRCRAWAGLVGRLERGLALAADYGHDRSSRPAQGTLTGYREGRPVPAIPDGTRDITAHVALDACAAAGRRSGAGATLLTCQRSALRSLGLTAQRPGLAQAAGDPLGYVRALQQAAEDAELTDRDGLGRFGWLIQTAGMDLPARLAGQPAPTPAGEP